MIPARAGSCCSRSGSGCRTGTGNGSRHELTDAGWRGRLTWRHLLVTLPLAAVLAAFPGPLFIHIMVPALFLICSVGVVAMYADDIRVYRLRRHGLQPPDDPDTGRPSH